MTKGGMCAGHKVAWGLVLVGALNWGLVGGFGFNLVNSLLGSMPIVEKVVYILVGLSALMMLMMGKCKKCHCGDKSCGPAEGKACGGEGEHKM
jgi:uncharacterized membrane protein YuzA (DUF378 family)